MGAGCLYESTSRADAPEPTAPSLASEIPVDEATVTRALEVTVEAGCLDQEHAATVPEGIQSGEIQLVTSTCPGPDGSTCTRIGIACGGDLSPEELQALCDEADCDPANCPPEACDVEAQSTHGAQCRLMVRTVEEDI